MSTNASGALSPADDVTLSEQIAALRNELQQERAAREAVEQRLDDLEQQRREDVHTLARENHDLRTELTEVRAELTDLRSEVRDYREENELDKAHIRKSVKNVESDVETIADTDSPDATPGGDGEETDRQNDETPLEQITRLPETTALKQLRANEERARFVATNIDQYASKAPAGYVLTSSDLSTVLAARDGHSPHTQTIARVMNFLDRFGKDHVEVVKRRGLKRVVFAEELVERLAQLEPPTEDNTQLAKTTRAQITAGVIAGRD